MKNNFVKNFLVLCLLFLPIGAFAQQSSYQSSTEVSIYSSVKNIEPNMTFMVGLKMKMDEGWHIYWRNPGDSGAPAQIEWIFPEGFKVEQLDWPHPVSLNEEGLVTYVYKDEVMFLSKVIPPANWDPKAPVNAKLNVKWLVCERICVPGTADLELNFPMVDEAAVLSANQIYEVTRRMPFKREEWQLSASDDENNIYLEFSSDDIKWDNDQTPTIEFFVDQPEIVNHAAPQILNQNSNGYELRVEKSSLLQSPLTNVSGILVSNLGWDKDGQYEALSVDVNVSPKPVIKEQPVKPMASGLNLWWAILFAFVGGLILNLMPCVLPVLSIKVLNLIKQANDSRLKIIQHGLAFTFGVVASFWVLAVGMLILQYAGHQVGWGFQFQSPIFVSGMAILFFILSLNLLGLFEVNVTVKGLDKKKSSGLVGSFLNGVLATIVATPCTAPFMGSALGFAITQPVIVVLGIFTSLGLGMAFPYLLLSIFPGWLKFVPKPGPWMIWLKRFFGVMMLLACVWLVWILSQQLKNTESIIEDPAEISQLNWIDYDKDKIDNLIKEGKPVFIDFTAKWCLTCQVNKKTSLHNKDVVEAFKKKGVVTVKADWTNYDEKITQALAVLGKNSIPVYVLYTKGNSDPHLLPEILTPRVVIHYLNKIEQN